MKIIIIISFTLLFWACQPPSQADFKTSSSAAASDMAPSLWPSSSFPLKVKVSEDFTQNEYNAIKSMSEAWTNSVDQEINFFEIDDESTPSKSSHLPSYNDNVIGVYKLYDWPAQLPKTALAVTQIYGTRRNVGKSNEFIRIDHADILINYDVFDFTTDLSWGYDLGTIVLHEFGHMLGLYHNSAGVDKSVMFPTITRFTINQTPFPKDIINLEQKYNISRSTQNRYIASTNDNQENYDNDDKVIIQFEMNVHGCNNHKH